MSPKQMNLLQGTLDVLILQALAQEARHGYGVAEWIHRGGFYVGCHQDLSDSDLDRLAELVLGYFGAR